MKFTTIKLEGEILSSEIIDKINQGDVEGQNSLDFGFDKKTAVKDEIISTWAEASSLWKAFKHRIDRVAEDDAGTTVTRNIFIVPFLSLLGFELQLSGAETLNGKSYAISHRDVKLDSLPVIVMGFKDSLDRKRTDGGPRMSAHGLMQEYLNLTEHLYGIITNGLQIRILRDSSRLIRQSYIEFDLERMFEEEQYSDFAVMFRLIHSSRFPLKKESADRCIFEKYHQDALDSGARIREGLSYAMEQSITLLGNGFLNHPANDELRELFSPRDDSDIQYYQNLLRILYRLLFLMVIEERNLIFGSNAKESSRKIYYSYYSINRLRNLSERSHSFQEKYSDIWLSLLNTFELFSEEKKGKGIDIEPLGGLFTHNAIGILRRCSIDNKTMLECFKFLNFFINNDTGLKVLVNYASLNVEEFGSVYEGMLDFHPYINSTGSRYTFKLAAGTERKTTGSYYTPEELVAELLKSALLPVIDDRLGGVITGKNDFSKFSIDERKSFESKLLDIKICDPACGSGHFLLGSARYMGKLLARLRTGEDEPSPSEINSAKRDVISRCVYGVDKNPMAVELCKVALWLEGHSAGNPLSFIDHHVRCGDSLVGVMDIEEIKKNGIPDNAFKAVTGDVKEISSNLKKLNAKYVGDAHIGSLFAEGPIDLSGLEEEFKKLDSLKDDSIDLLKAKEKQYRKIKSEGGLWSKTETICNLWTAAFFIQHTENNKNNKRLITNDEFFRYINGEQIANSYTSGANSLASELRFFHWELEFPEVFSVGGFDCVIGNPPWEMLQFSEKEYFQFHDNIISQLEGDKRKRAIEELKIKNADLYSKFEKAKYYLDAVNRFIRECGRFPLTATGKLNTYSLFSETVSFIKSTKGRFGIIVPTGIATDDGNKLFFENMIKNNSLVSLFDFENKKALFQSVHRSFKFSLLTAGFNNTSEALFSFFLTTTSQFDDKLRRFTLTSEEISLLNPNTMTCPVFRTYIDAELSKKIYKNGNVFINERRNDNLWEISFKQGLFNMATDSQLFKVAIDRGLVPLYEGKLFHQFDHRWSSYNSDGETIDVAIEDKKKNNYSITPRYWIEEKLVNEKINEKWFICFRDITNATNERTTIVSIIPKVGVGHTAPLIISKNNENYLLISNLNSIAFDYNARQKIGGTHLTFSLLKQLPVLPPERYSQKDIDFIKPRVLELVYTAYDLKPFAVDMGYDGEPFPWDEDRRALLRAELDAYYAKLYGLDRDELRYILDPQDVYGEDFPGETFRVLKEGEIKKYGEYRTRRLVLEAWDRLWG